MFMPFLNPHEIHPYRAIFFPQHSFGNLVTHHTVSKMEKRAPWEACYQSLSAHSEKKNKITHLNLSFAFALQ